MASPSDEQTSDSEPRPDTAHLVRKTRTDDADQAWTSLSEKIIQYVRVRFSGAGLPPTVEFDDFVSDLMSRTMSSIDSFEDRGAQSFWRWVQTIAGNVRNDMWRRYNRDRQLGLAARGSEQDEDVVDSCLSTEDSPTSIVRIRELEQAERDCVELLPPTLREVYLMRRVLEMSFAEISERKDDAKLATLRSHYLRGRETVRSCLARRVDKLGDRLSCWR